MFPHERSLVKRMEGRPFALIGVNSDSDPEYLKLKRQRDLADDKEKYTKQLEQIDWSKFKQGLKEKNEKQQITWRSFWNGPDGTQGPISKEWNVQGWPTLYIMDHKGVIRQKYVVGSPGDKVLDEEIDKLVAEAEKK